MKRVRSVEVPVGYVIIPTEEYRELITIAAQVDAQAKIEELTEVKNTYRDRCWELEKKLKKGGLADGDQND